MALRYRVHAGCSSAHHSAALPVPVQQRLLNQSSLRSELMPASSRLDIVQPIERALASSDGVRCVARRLISARPAAATAEAPSATATRSSICVSVTATSVESFISEISEVERAGADIVELRLDFIKVKVSL